MGKTDATSVDLSSINERIEATEAWIVEMNTDFGKDDLEYSKNKAETDMEKNGEDETIRSSASDCKSKLDEAIQKLRDFIRELSIAIEYEEKQWFLVHWLQQCELSLSKEPCKITVRD